MGTNPKHPPPPVLKFCPLLRLCICASSECRFALPAGKVVNHLVQKHNVPIKDARETAFSFDKFEPGKNVSAEGERYLVNPFPCDEQPLPPLPSLPIITALVQCTICELYCNGKKACRVHIGKKHKGHSDYKKAINAVSTSVLRTGQTVFGGRQKLYFPVQILEKRDGSATIANEEAEAVEYRNVTEIDKPGVLDSLYKCSDQQKKLRDEVALLDYSMNAWAEEMKIADFLRRSNLTCDDAFQVSSGGCPSVRENILKLTLSYFEFFSRKNPRVPFPLIDMVRIQDRDTEANFNLYVQDKTKRRYARSITRMICTVSTLISSDALPQSVFIPPELRRAVETLTSNAGKEGRRESLERLHVCFKELLLRSVNASKGETVAVENISLLVLAGFSSTEGGRTRVGDAEDASHLAAALQYCCQMCALGEFLISPHGFGSSYTDRMNSDRERRADIENMLCTKGVTPASFIRKMLLRTKRLSAGETPRLSFASCDRHGAGIYCGVLGAVEVPLNLPEHETSLATVVRRIQRKAVNILRRKIMCGYKLPALFWDSIFSISDKFGCKDPGHWLGGKEHESLTKEWASSFATHVSHTKEPLFVWQNGNWKHSPFANDWLQVCDTFSRTLYTLVHICSGGPPRGTEMGTAKIRNTASGRRSVYIYKKTVAIIISYSKTSNQFLPKPIARFLDDMTGRLLLMFIFLVKPVLAKVVQSTLGSEMAEQDFLFARNGKMMEPHLLYTFFKKTLNEEGIPMGMLDYRHYRTGIVKMFLGGDFDAPFGDCGDFAQAGHSVQTANIHYAHIEQSFKELSTPAIESFLRCSQKWHRLLCLDKGWDVEVCERNSGQVSDKNDGTGNKYLKTLPVRDNELVPITPVTEEQGTEELQEPTCRIAVPSRPVSQFLADFESLESASELHGCEESGEERVSMLSGHKEVAGQKRKKVQHLTDNEGTSLKKLCRCGFLDPQTALTDMYGGRGEPAFLSTEQKLAVEESLLHGKGSSSRTCTLVVLPTGGGKTMCWTLPAVQEQRRCQQFAADTLVTIVIVPLVSLQDEMLRRAKNIGLNAVNWDNRLSAGASVIICPVDEISTEGYKNFVIGTSRMKRLMRIVFDEAHTLVLWRTYRKFGRIQELIRPIEVSVPLLLLTATAPPEIVGDIFQSVGADNQCLKVIRAGTERKNISYNVKYITTSRRDGLIRLAVDKVCEVLGRLNFDDKIIVYCLSRLDACSIRRALGSQLTSSNVHLYHGSMPNAVRTINVQNWHAGDGKNPQVLVGTTAIGCGLDHSKVRYVLHAGGSYSVVEFVQESGRLGRDGNPATNLVLYNAEYYHEVVHRNKNREEAEPQAGREDSQKETKVNVLQSESFVKWVSSRYVCRRIFLAAQMDGKIRSCCSNVEEESCDVCVARRTMSIEQKNLPIEFSRGGIGVRNVKDQDMALGTTFIPKKLQHDNTNRRRNAFSIEETEELRWKLFQIAERKCAVCIFSNRSALLMPNHSICMTARCFRCMKYNAKHQSSTCKAIPRSTSKEERRCFFCGLREQPNVHMGTTFNSSACAWGIVKNLYLLAWLSCKHRDTLVGHIPELGECKTEFSVCEVLFQETEKVIPLMVERFRHIYSMFIQ